jgi:hypothetical protein
VLYSGFVTNADLRVGLDTYTKVPLDYAFLIDLTEVQDFDVTPEGVRQAVEAWGKTPRKRVVLAPTPTSYGFARMYATLSDRSGIEIFRDAEAAWKKLKSGDG